MNNESRTQPMIEAERLAKFYGAFTAVRDVSFRVNRGEVVAFLGPNGAGKSTTLKLLTGYLSPSEGRARIGGFDMATERIAGSRLLGYLPENGPLYPDMTPFSLLSFFADARGMSASRKRDRMHDVIDLCAISSVLHKPIGKLSKGFRQRVGMAQALLHEPDVLIMDEPTAGLDPNQIHEVRETLLRLGREKTILMSTHIMQEVDAIANRAIVIHEGRLIYDGRIAELTAGGQSLEARFRELTRQQPPKSAPFFAKEERPAPVGPSQS